jgi:ABC-type antimicrobial peptide transport system permease subunit
MAYMVVQRTGEIGVRRTLGADRGRVARMVLRGAFSRAAIGLAIGILAAIGAAIVQRKTLGPGHAGIGHVGVRTGSVARIGAAPPGALRAWNPRWRYATNEGGMIYLG